MQLIDDDIDFNAYLEMPPELAHVRRAPEYRNALVDRFHGDNTEAGTLMPWDKTHGKILLRPGKVSIWSGYTHHGKTQMLKQCMNYAMFCGDKVCVASMEETADEAIETMLIQAAHTKEPSIPMIDCFAAWTDGKLWMYDQQGIVDAERLIAVMNYAAKEFGINHFVIDSLMKTNIRFDDYARQTEFVNLLGAHARPIGVHVHLVAHSRKPDSRGNQSRPGTFDIAGHGNISNQADNIFIVGRNLRKEDEAEKINPDPEIMKEPDALLVTEKQRGRNHWRGKTGLWFHKLSGQFLGGEYDRPQHYFKFDQREWQ